MEDYCCFYANKSGIVKEAARDLTNKASRIPQHLSNSWENCLNNWNWMSWVLPFLGPLFLLTLILTFGPCLMHLLSKFLWHRSQDFINQTIHELLLIRSNYQKLRSHKNLIGPHSSLFLSHPHNTSDLQEAVTEQLWKTDLWPLS